MCVHTRQELWAFVSIFQGPCGVYSICDMRVPFLPLLTIPSHQEWPIMSRITEINQDLSLLCYCYCCATSNTNISRPQRYLSIHPSPFGIRHSCLGWLKFKPLSTFFYWCTHQLHPPPPPPILILRHTHTDTHVVDLVRFYRRQQAAATALDYLRHISFFRPTRCSSSPLQKMIDGTLVAVININQDWWWCGDVSGKQIEVWIWLRSTTYL